MDFECDVNSIYSNDYYDLIINYKGDLESTIEKYKPACFQIVDSDFVLLYIKRDISIEELYFKYTILETPRPLGPYGKSSLERSGISYFHERPTISLRGKDVLVGVIDSGIDYTNKCFIYEDNTSKIVSIWDQTIQGKPPEGIMYGTEFTNQDINKALASDNPFEIVPQRDTLGHGTFLAGIAAGREDDVNDFVGAAPDAELVIVKLKPAKAYIREYFLINEGAIAYQDTDIVMGIKYLIQVSQKLNKPLSIVIGLGSNYGSHDGTSWIEACIGKTCKIAKTCVSVAAGNEADKGHHYRGQFQVGEAYQDIEVDVAENEKGFILFIQGSVPDEMSIGVSSPIGEYTGQLPLRVGAGETIEFLLEETVLQVKYYVIELGSGAEMIFIRFVNPTESIWTIRIFGDFIVNGRYDVWLPRMDYINELTRFINPNPFTTVAIPSTIDNPITVGAYYHLTSELYIASGRGLTSVDELKPELVAPGVNVFGPFPKNRYGTMTGTSVAAAHVAGAAALLFEWGIVLNNDPTLSNLKIKMFLVRGARRRDNLIYPNREWGYGELDLLNAFDILKGRLW